MKKFFLVAIAILSIGVASAQTQSDDVVITFDNAKTITVSQTNLYCAINSLTWVFSTDDLATIIQHASEVENEKVKSYKYKNTTLNIDLNKGVATLKIGGHTIQAKNVFSVMKYFINII